MENFGLAGIVMLGLFFFGIIAYFVIMFIWPEWVGISGKDSEKTLKSHVEGAPSSQATDRLGDFLSGGSSQSKSDEPLTSKNSRKS